MLRHDELASTTALTIVADEQSHDVSDLGRVVVLVLRRSELTEPDNRTLVDQHRHVPAELSAQISVRGQVSASCASDSNRCRPRRRSRRRHPSIRMDLARSGASFEQGSELPCGEMLPCATAPECPSARSTLWKAVVMGGVRGSHRPRRLIGVVTRQIEAEVGVACGWSLTPDAAFCLVWEVVPADRTFRRRSGVEGSVTVVGVVDVARVSEWDGLTSTYLALHGEAVEWAVRITRDRAMAEDVVQDAFVQVFSRLRIPLGDDAVRPYVRRAVINAALSRLRSERRRRSREVRASDRPWADVDPGADHELWELVQRLPRRQFAVIALRYWLDQSEAETARLLRCRVGTVKSLAARAVATLRKELGDG